MAKKKNVEVKEVIENKQEKEPTFIMKVGKLSWGKNNRNQFFNDDKPLICKSVMKEYSSAIDEWIKAGWIEEGSYKHK